MKTALFVGSVLVAVPLLYYAFFHESEEGIIYDMVEQFAKGVDGVTAEDAYVKLHGIDRPQLRRQL